MPDGAAATVGPAGPSAGQCPSGPSKRAGFQPGLLLLQAQRLEDLAQTVMAWCTQYPPAPLEEEVVLVPSNGMAEWFKAHAAMGQGIFAGARVELPARWAWRIYQTVLGEHAHRAAVFDKTVLPWHLAAHWPAWGRLPSVRTELNAAGLSTEDAAPPGALALWRWCAHAADLYDQYQLYRPDWLDDWSQGLSGLRTPEVGGQTLQPVPPEQAWQVELWAWLTRAAAQQAPAASPVREAHAGLSRAEVHRTCIDALKQCAAGTVAGLPGRVTLFGTTSLPPQILELLDALSRHAAVILAVPNPCRVQWIDLAQAPREGNPLLAAWGKQARDFLTQIEAFDDRLEQVDQRRMARVEREDELQTASALERLQAAIHRNEPLSETAAACRADGASLDDGSIRMVTAHTALREVEILHDHLLHELAAPQAAARIQPHEVIVMVPDLSTHSAAIKAVFGAFPEGDPRHIPWGLADQQAQAEQGLLELANWLLSLPVQRCTASDLHRLLQTPALCVRWGLDEEDCRQLSDWVNASGIRWGLSPLHREMLGLGAAGGSMTWRSGVDRMLAGYAGTESFVLAPDVTTRLSTDACGDAPVPLDRVRGLAAHAAGQLAALLRRLEEWLIWASQPHDPQAWSAAFRKLWTELLEPGNTAEIRESQTVEAAFTSWLRATQAASFTGVLDHTVVREAITAEWGQHPLGNRFRSNGVTFCTLMPLRAVPFQIVCLLGMNDGHYPRPTTVRRADLMADPSRARPGDRSRRTDDRQLMLDALLSARRQLVVSWVGHRASDNESLPPSVLVGQFRDVLASIWSESSVRVITTHHPLQPFSPAYFREGPLPPTHVHEWQPASGANDRHIHAHRASSASPQAHMPPTEPEAILRWLRCPVTAFWEDRLGVRWPSGEDSVEDAEPLGFTGLTAWQAWDETIRLLELAANAPHSNAACAAETLRPSGSSASSASSASSEPSESYKWACACARRLQRLELLPLAAPGRWQVQQLLHSLELLHRRFHALRAQHPSEPLQLVASHFLGHSPAPNDRGQWRLHLLIEAWWQQALQAAHGTATTFHLLTPDAVVTALPMDREQATAAVEQVTRCVTEWMSASAPMPATSRLVAALQRPASLGPPGMDRVSKGNGSWRRSFGPAAAWAWQEGADGRPWQEWHHASMALYGPFWQWCGSHLRVQLNADATEAESS